MDFSETIVSYDLKLPTDDPSDKKFLLTSKLRSLGAVCPRATDNYSGNWVFHSIKFNELGKI